MHPLVLTSPSFSSGPWESPLPLSAVCLGFMAFQVHHGRSDGCALCSVAVKPGPFPAVALRFIAHSGFVQDGQSAEQAVLVDERDGRESFSLRVVLVCHYKRCAVIKVGNYI